ncbi:MAG: MFS transporter [Alphaproteobacteria bacterium]
MTTSSAAATLADPSSSIASAMRGLVIGSVGFLTLVDLFAAQAILPSLIEAYHVSRATIGFAVNASTMGMAAAGLLVALISRRINRKNGIWISLALLAIPTTLLASAPDLATFTALRIAQGVFMASAFTLTMTYLAEQCSAKDAAAALAAYITGGVASNLIGRLVSASIADMFGLATNFYAFAALNLAGAALVLIGLGRATPMTAMEPARSALAAWLIHLRNGALRSTFAIGFLILFAFIGTFTYVNFVLTAPPIGLGQMELGFVYFVFLPSILTTPLAGRAALRFGTRPTFWSAIAVAAAGLPLVLVPHLIAVLAGMTLIGVGTFFAQAAATGFIGRAATSDRAAASGLYLASYYCGGLVGAFVLGQLFDGFGWAACVAGIGVALGLAALLARPLAMATTR